MTFEFVLEKFKASGCPLLENADVGSSQEWIYGDFLTPYFTKPLNISHSKTHFWCLLMSDSSC